MTALIVILLVTGLILLLVELTLIPGFGVVGILGVAAMLTGSILAFRQYGALWGGAVVVGTVLVSVVAVVVVLKSGISGGLALKPSVDRAAVPDDLERLVGTEGVAESMLRPSGSALFGEERMTVLTDGLYLKKGTPIRVSRVEGGKVVVEPIEEQETADSKDGATDKEKTEQGQ